MLFTLCGSARLESLYHAWNKRLGFMGHHSFALMTYPSIEGDKTWYTPDEKWLLDLLHFAKIEDSEAVLILNKDGYIGESTGRELLWSQLRRKKIYVLEPWHLDHKFQGVNRIPGWKEYVAKYNWPEDLPGGPTDKFHYGWDKPEEPTDRVLDRV